MVFKVAVCPEDVGGETHEASSGVYLPIRCNKATIKQRSTGGGRRRYAPAGPGDGWRFTLSPPIESQTGEVRGAFVTARIKCPR